MKLNLAFTPPSLAFVCLGGFVVVVCPYLCIDFLGLSALVVDCFVDNCSFRTRSLYTKHFRVHGYSSSVHFSMISLLVKETFYINEVILGTTFGVFIGPYGINVFNPWSWGNQQDEITLTVMRLILVSGLFAAGIELPCAYMEKHARGFLVMVVPTMAFGWFMVADGLTLLTPSVVFPTIDGHESGS